MNTFGFTAIGIGVFALLVGFIVILMEQWHAHHGAQKHKHA